MDNRHETIKQIKTLLKSHRKGLTITDVAQKLHLNRNSAAKYLEILLISGEVNLNAYGPSKVYTIAQRMPVSALVKFSTDLIILIDSGMRVLDANENALSMLGLSREDLAGNRVETINSPLLARLAIPDVFDEIQKSGEIQREFSIPSDNEERHYRVRLIPTVFDNLEDGITIIGEDITEQIRFEQYLMVSEARYRGIVQDQADFICRGSPDGAVTFINEPLARFIGISSSDVSGKSIFSYIHPEDLPFTMEKMAGLTPDQSTNTIEIRVMNHDGTYRWNMWSSRGIFDNTGTMVEWQSVGRDITERKQMEEALTRIQKAVDSSSEAIGIATPDGRHIYQNPALTKLFGYTTEEFARVPLPIIAYEDAQKGREIFETIMQGNSCSGEIVVISKDGRKLDTSYHADAIRDDKGKIIGLIGIHTDITERKQVEKALSESELLYRTILENIQDVYYRADPEGRLVRVSQSAQKLLGCVSLDEIIGENIAEKFYFYPEKRKDFLKVLYEQQQIADYEITLKKPDGSPVEISTNSHLLFDSEGHVNGIEGFFRDITFRKKAEQAIRESEERYRNVVEDQTEFICRFTPDGIFVFVNEAYCRYYGMKREEIMGTRFRPVVHPEDRENVARLFASLIPGNQVGVIDHRTIMPDGSIRWQRWADRAIFHADGSLKEYQSVGRDITKTKQDEEELRESEERFRTLLERVQSVAVQGYLQDYTVVYWNVASTLMYGYTAEEAIGRDIRELLIPVQARDEVTAAIARMAETGIPEPSAELELLHKDGSLVPVFSSHAIVKIPGRSTVQFCFDVDLSDRKKAENAIRESEERYRNVVEDQTEFICRFTPDGTFVFVNEAYCHYYGMKREEIMGTRFRPVVHPEDRENIARLFASLTPGNQVGVIDHRTIMPDGSIRWQRWADRAIFHADGSLKEYQSVGRDITKTKQDEEALRESEERYRNVVEDQTEFICRFTPDGTFVFVNEAYCRYYGRKREEIMGTRFRPVVHPEDRENVARLFASLTPGNQVGVIDHRTIMPDGSIRWQRWADRAIFHADGSLKEYQSVGRDITKTKQDEEALRESEERFRMVTELSPFPISIMDGASNCRYLNTGFERLFGYTQADIPTGKDWFLKAFPNDIERNEAISTWKNDLAHSSSEETRSHVYLVTCKDGTVRQVRFSALPLQNGEQFIVYEDLTQKNELDRLNSVLASIVDYSNDAIIGKTLDGTIISWNNAAERIYGYQADEIIGKSVEVIISPELRDQLPLFLERVRNGEHIEYFQTIRVRKDGTPVAVSITMSPIRDENGGISGISTIARNIPDTCENDLRRAS